MSKNLGVWIAALCTLGIYSILYRENRFYRLFEHLFVGISAGFGLFITWRDGLKPLWWDPMVVKGHWYWIFAAVIGLLWYFLYSKKYIWLSRIVIGLLLGAGAGLGIKVTLTVIAPQISGSFKPPFNLQVPFSDNFKLPLISQNLSNFICFVTLVSVLVYFFFSIEHKRAAVRVTARLGRLLMMISFGAMFGSTFMARISLFIGRLMFLFMEWLKIAK